MAVKLTKAEAEVRLVSLKKKAEAVLEFKGLGDQKFRVVAIIDISGSMSGLFANHVVQDTCNRYMGIVLNFDDNAAADIIAFGINAHDLGEISKDNFHDFAESITRRHRFEGGTNYAPAMQMVVDKFFPGALSNGNAASAQAEKKGLFGKMFGGSKAAAPAPTTSASAIAQKPLPVYALFVTDGNNGDQTQAERIIRESAALPIFWQFVGVGREQFEFLRKLDDLKGRVVDNADFYPVADLDRVSDEELYENILGELPTWLSEVKAKGMI
jgi:hypothetical protein